MSVKDRGVSLMTVRSLVAGGLTYICSSLADEDCEPGQLGALRRLMTAHLAARELYGSLPILNALTHVTQEHRFLLSTHSKVAGRPFFETIISPSEQMVVLQRR